VLEERRLGDAELRRREQTIAEIARIEGEVRRLRQEANEKQREAEALRCALFSI
jgi:HAMP domain-containing protein